MKLPIKNPAISPVVLLLFLSTSFNVHAKSTDEKAPLHIEADKLEMREKEDVSIYTGHVKITRGSMKVTGDKVVIKNNNGKLHSIHINGRPATFYQLNDLNEEISAESYSMDYRANTGILELKQKAILLKNKNRFSSEHIIYNTLQDIVKAGKGTPTIQTSPQDTPKVKITIYPETTNN